MWLPGSLQAFGQPGPHGLHAQAQAEGLGAGLAATPEQENSWRKIKEKREESSWKKKNWSVIE